ncbi:MAG: mechanosensitive ion channel family protein [Lachnospiraceae bacterium]|nr:mechanosensitive ion channel family protein [Lachnospiraceae bacterium]
MAEYEDIIVKSIIPILITFAVIVVSGILLGKRGKPRSLHRRYLLQMVRLLVVLACVADIVTIFDPTLKISQILLRGSALVVAIVGFAAQAAISDIICGLLISVHKPFEIGDRIIVEGLEPGIVEDITLRHTVLRIYDDLRIIVPNSELNSKTVTNTSYKKADRRGIHLKYAVSYDTDVNKAMEIIRDCVVESPYTLSVETNGITEDSGPVYFLNFADSALMLDTTIWVTKNTNSYTAITDINIRVNNAFNKNGIEIPYNYMNVVEFKGTKNEAKELEPMPKKTTPSKRHFRTNTLKLKTSEERLAEAVDVTQRYAAKRFAAKQRLDTHEAIQLELLCEESLRLVGGIMKDVRADLWIEGSGQIYRIHIRFNAKVGSAEYRSLLGISSEGRNEAAQGINGWILDKLMKGSGKIAENRGDVNERLEWTLNEDPEIKANVGETILTSVASDIRVSIEKERVELVIIREIPF